MSMSHDSATCATCAQFKAPQMEVAGFRRMHGTVVALYEPRDPSREDERRFRAQIERALREPRRVAFRDGNRNEVAAGALAACPHHAKRLASGRLKTFPTLVLAPPGSGKRSLAHFAAREMQCPVLEITPELLSGQACFEDRGFLRVVFKYVEEREGRIVLLFTDLHRMVGGKTAPAERVEDGLNRHLFDVSPRHDVEVIATATDYRMFSSTLWRKFDVYEMNKGGDNGCFNCLALLFKKKRISIEELLKDIE